MMRVYEAWSPENSQLIFRGKAAVNTVSAALDAVLQDPIIRKDEIDSLVNLNSIISYQIASGEAKVLAVKNNHVESDLVHRGLRSLVRRPAGIEEPTVSDHYRAWKASRLIGKIARATV